MMNEVIAILVALIAGLIMGFAIKKVIKWLMIGVGVLLVIAFLGVYQGWFDPDYNKITADATSLVNNTNIYPQLTNNFSPVYLVMVGIGFVVGFIKTS